LYVSFLSVARLPSRITLAITFAVLLAGGGAWYRDHTSRVFFDQRRLLSRFPAEDALALSIDVATLRRAGLLKSSTKATEPEYKQFSEATGFDYRRDLDSVVASFSRSGTFILARGVFNWAKLREYTTANGGSCYQDLCRAQGSKPDRHISFLPLRKDAIAIAVSSNDLAATLLTKTGQPVKAAIPSAPVWISVPGAELRQQNALPPAMRMMLSALTTADRVLITFGPTASAGMEARLEATCRTQNDARLLASQLRITTATLKEALIKDKKAADDEVVSLLTGGSFDQSDRLVTGRWPVRKSLLDALTDGI
jgi:hypothetical protein